MQPSSIDAYRLFHQGAVALAKMERVGMPVDMTKLAASREEVAGQIGKLETNLRRHEVYKLQQKIYGKDTSLGSREQLADVLFNRMGYAGAKKGKNGKYALDEDVLRNIACDYIDEYLRLQKLCKLKGTYLDAMHRDAVNGRVHGFMNLHNVKSFRGSADSPNLNNLPSRNKAITRLVKGCVCPPEGYYLVESDYTGLEVYTAASYHHDPTMIDNLENGFDMHTAISKQCYKYDDDFIKADPGRAKELRQAAKGDAVFSWFYGNYYVDVALPLWKTAHKMGLMPHLESQGIKRLGLEFDAKEGVWVESPGPDAFVTHIKGVEHDFWNNRYAVYGQWRRDWYNAYLAKGFFHTLTGFTWAGVEKRNFVVNCPIQGSAFHCLLQAIIDTQAEIAKRKMKSRLFLEIHDSMLALVPRSEIHEYMAMATEIMTTKLRAKWSWIRLELKVEHELSDVSWADKKKYTGEES